MCLKAKYRMCLLRPIHNPGQDRIPMSSSSTTAPPPYPMKLAPADHQTGKSNGRHTLFFFSNVSNKNCWPSNRRSGLSTYTSGDLRVPGQTSQVVKILIIWQGHDVFGGLRRDSSEITFRFFFVDSSSNMVLVLVTSGAIMVVLDYAYIPIPKPPFKCFTFDIHHLFPCSGTQAIKSWGKDCSKFLPHPSTPLVDDGHRPRLSINVSTK